MGIYFANYTTVGSMPNSSCCTERKSGCSTQVSMHDYKLEWLLTYSCRGGGGGGGGQRRLVTINSFNIYWLAMIPGSS